MTAAESADVRLSRLEEKIDGMNTLLEEKFDGLNCRLSERCSGHLGRIESLEKTTVRFGERIGKLEADQNRQKGGKAVIMGMLTAGAAAGGLLVKMIEWMGRVG